MQAIEQRADMVPPRLGLDEAQPTPFPAGEQGSKAGLWSVHLPGVECGKWGICFRPPRAVACGGDGRAPTGGRGLSASVA